MPEDTTTQCLLFPGISPKNVVACFDQQQGSSDGGAILLKAADRRYGLIDALASCLHDERQVGKIEHTLQELCKSAAESKNLPYGRKVVGCVPLLRSNLETRELRID